jgi:XTP/dITP diphosphohydrolase
MPLTLYLASTNPGKLREFHEAALTRGILIETVPGIEQLPPCVEDGETFEMNARKKALHYAAWSQGMVFADDSGICVDALAGAPGVYSARYSGPGATDGTNNQKLIAELRRKVAEDGRRALRVPIEAPPGTGFPAHYECVIALARKEQILTLTEGRVDGVIIETPRGSGGFGYDPYFFYPPFGMTFAEISAEEKFAVSHRGIAFRKLLDFMAENLRF